MEHLRDWSGSTSPMQSGLWFLGGLFSNRMVEGSKFVAPVGRLSKFASLDLWKLFLFTTSTQTGPSFTGGGLTKCLGSGLI